MPIRVHFVAAIGRVSEGDLAARPQIESICARNGGRIVGGMGDSTNPIVGEFNERAGACAAAQEAFYLDSVEFAKVLGDNAPGEVTNRIGESVTSGAEAVDAVAAGMSVKDVVESLIKSCSENLMGSNPTPEDVAAYKAGYADGAAKKPAQPTADKAYVYGYEHGFKLNVPLFEGAEPLDEAKTRWGHTLKKGMKVKVAQARGEAVDDEIADFHKADDYSRAYGRQVTLKSGRSAGVNDCIPA